MRCLNRKVKTLDIIYTHRTTAVTLAAHAHRELYIDKGRGSRAARTHGSAATAKRGLGLGLARLDLELESVPNRSTIVSLS